MATQNALNNSSAPFTVTAGDLTVTAGNIKLPNTTNTPTGQIQFGSNRFVHNYGTGNTFIGTNAGNTTLTTGSSITNTAVGQASQSSLTTSPSNSSVGHSTLTSLTSGSGFNSCIGYLSLANLATGTNNTALGYGTGTSYTTSESNNILIGAGVSGTAAESNTIRLGSVSNTSCYIGGINGVTVANPSIVTLNTSTGQLGNTSYVTGGTFTPVLSFGGGTTGITYAEQFGYYTRLGNQIFISITLVLTNKGSSTGAASIAGLPVTCNTSSHALVAGFSNLTFTGQVYGVVSASTTTCSPVMAASGGAIANILDTGFANNTTLRLNGSYFV